MVDPVSVCSLVVAVVATGVAGASYREMKRSEQAKARAELRVEEMLHREAAGVLRDELHQYQPVLDRFIREQVELGPSVRKHADGMDANGALVRGGIAEERRCPRLPAENYEAIVALLAEERSVAEKLSKYIRKCASAIRELLVGEDAANPGQGRGDSAADGGDSAANDAQLDERVTPFRKRK
jgi:hypothetical protein